jgi:hypothetical protein
MDKYAKKIYELIENPIIQEAISKQFLPSVPYKNTVIGVYYQYRSGNPCICISREIDYEKDNFDKIHICQFKENYKSLYIDFLEIIISLLVKPK